MTAEQTYPADAWHTFYGRGVWALGDGGDMGVMVQGADRRSYAALSCYLREQGEDRSVKPQVRRVREFHTQCGCTPEQHQKHRDDDLDCDCENYGLPPCEPDMYAWTAEPPRGNEDGLPVLWVNW